MRVIVRIPNGSVVTSGGLGGTVAVLVCEGVIVT